ncbi:PglL family O-oligosaccharyltransferase [Polaromonas sp.]|uniref:PglL family O-oligosaccharyltransferase n=1 Tax=Polaromonas sp. TaxID=1869339 RepID=UPI0025D4B5ED|nr:Wzy polymerase domain-containing protein [Polaromonas sp.]
MGLPPFPVSLFPERALPYRRVGLFFFSMPAPFPAFMVALLVALPWLNPVATNPSPYITPLLVAGFCLAVLVFLLAWMPTQTIGRGLGSWLASAWLFAALVSSLVGLCQYFGEATGFAPWMSQAGPGEAVGNLRQRNHFASLTNIGLMALVWFVATRDSNGHWRVLGVPIAALLAVACAASSSRTGLLQLAFILAMLYWWGMWRKPGVHRLMVTAIMAYALAMLALPWMVGLDISEHGMVARLQAGDLACAGRLTLWSNVLTLIGEKPWLGWGWGELDYAHYMTLYPGARFCDILGNAHNLPLHLAVELGIPFAATVCIVLSWLVWRARPWRETDPLRQMAWAVLALIGLHSLLEYPLWYGPFQMTVGLCVYLLWMKRTGFGDRSDSPQPQGAGAGVARHVFGVAGVILLAAVAYGAWDYHRVSQIYRAPAQRHPAYRENTLEKISATRLFRREAEFAALSLTPLTPANALQIYAQSRELLHFSPEPRVIEKVIESAVVLGRDEEALRHLARYRAAFPLNHAKWRGALGIAPLPVD